ncbi:MULTISPECIES: cytochrome c oxidase accessory protein CcoG [unclassified Agarivorans]|uniref:cytochrome c oxidase accessory protein CcoG n=1 Tax=unclassified Agarivorans TaxID=2636026 RepID=UPI0026E1EDA5|nr:MULTISPECIES: cytochrome c oxidase accessory protein CcoG [unclassified Agarivorans]MDO6685799.1 cytochrome c oxidase accessory protein CcoG [Agarivorans sp. 3_MG-2023]MDO6716086.1 cytochrome c oxidase accessory protein CcoG [Agarivorans sp. 2_MG-2023]
MSERIPVKDVSPKPKAAKKRAPVDRYNPQEQIYVREQKGVFQRLRKYMGWVFIAAFVIVPFIPYGDRQAILLDMGARQYHFFSLTLWPQDLLLLAWFFIIAAFALFFITTFLGRVWCGYLCPQTVWTFIFIWFEEKIEGSANKRKRLDQSSWNFNKVWRKTAKHSAWIAVSVFTALSFAAYFVPVTELWRDFFTLNASSAVNFSVIFFTVATYANAGWMRTIVCTHMCPYARFQSAMFDKDTFIVAYDTERGESRGPRKRSADPKALGLGDCVDCDLCVQVCPAGIDIREGLQYECINCGACIDACDQTMEKMNYPKGLIRYTTEHNLAGQKTDILRPKLIGYGVVLTLMLVAFVFTLLSVKPMQLDVLRDRGALYTENSEGLVENSYTLKVINKSSNAREFHLSVRGFEEVEWIGQQIVTVPGGEVFSVPITLASDPYLFKRSIVDIEFVLESGDDQFIQASRFISGG